MRITAEVEDTLLAHHLICPDLPHDLGFIASQFTNLQAWKHTAEEDKERYNAIDVDATAQIWPQLEALLKQNGLWELYRNVSIPVGKICASMTAHGLRVDVNRIKEVRRKIIEEQKELEGKLPEELKTHEISVNRRIPAPTGYTSPKTGKSVKFMLVPSSETVVPWRSDKTVGQYLYTTLKLPIQKHVKTGKTTTGKDAIERLARIHGRPELLAIKKLRGLDELLTSFAKEKVTFGTSVHPHFSVHGTNSGRLSSSGPNIQNQPESIRCIFIPHKANHTLVQVDFSSIENRITAHLAGDTERLRRFADPNFSEHKWAVEKFFGTPMALVEKSTDPDSEYSKAKHIVHGKNYGLGARKMSMMYGIPEREVKRLVAAWDAAIPLTHQWQQRTYEEAKSKGFLTNSFGRKRWFSGMNVYTESLSFLPQSTAADIILRCMIGLYWDRVNWPIERARQVCPVLGALPKDVFLLAQIHDALLLEAPNDKVHETVQILKNVLEQPWRELAGFWNPIVVEVGPSWGEMKKYGN